MDIDWNDIPMLLALAESGSMTAAGRALGLDTSTISRRLVAAETLFGMRLFVRETAGYRPTEAGQEFVQRARTIYGDVQDMLQFTRAQAIEIAGPVRITALGFLLDHWLIERLLSLQARHPKLEWTLIAANENLSFTRRETDFALRLARPTDDAAVLMTRVGTLGFAVYGSEKFAKLPRERWGEVSWLCYDDEYASLPEMQWLTATCPKAKRRVQTSSVTALMRACEAGAGLALLPCIAASGSNLARLSSEPELYRELWLLSHKEVGKIKKMRTVADNLRQFLEADALLLQGTMLS